MSQCQEIKDRVDIVDFISTNVSLHHSGRNFVGLCPFHSEKTASFFVFPERQSWRCFGSCATGGDIFTFVQHKENIGFGDAMKMLKMLVFMLPFFKQQQQIGRRTLC